MRLVQVGFGKSGNYWLYTLLQSIAKEMGWEQKRYVHSQPIYPLSLTWEPRTFPEQMDLDFLFLNDFGMWFGQPYVFRFPIESFDEFYEKSTYAWTHSPYSAKGAELIDRFDRTVYIIRDVRDVLISLLNFWRTPYLRKFSKWAGALPPGDWTFDQLPKPLKYALTCEWFYNVTSYLANLHKHNMHVVFYERLLKQFDSELMGLQNYFGIELKPDQIERIKNAVSVTTMKEKAPTHVRKAKSGGWRNLLTAENNAEVLQIAGPILEMLGYPLDPADDSLPKLPEKIDVAAVEKAVRNAHQFMPPSFSPHVW